MARQKDAFHLIFSELTRSDSTKPEEVLMVAATDVKAYRTASSLKKGVLHFSCVMCNEEGCPVGLHLSKGQCSDFTGADLLLRDPPVQPP